VLLGGAALTRGYVEDDLEEIYDGEVHCARDAFEGLVARGGHRISRFLHRGCDESRSTTRMQKSAQGVS
jgi:cobalamin-dependent methionine synthase I